MDLFSKVSVGTGEVLGSEINAAANGGPCEGFTSTLFVVGIRDWMGINVDIVGEMTLL